LQLVKCESYEEKFMIKQLKDLLRHQLQGVLGNCQWYGKLLQTAWYPSCFLS